MPYRQHMPSMWTLKRDLEWMLASILLAFGLVLLRDGKTFSISRSYADMAARMSEDAWGWSAVLVGSAWLGVLWINGRHKRTPLARVVFSGLGAMFFASLAQSFWLAALDAFSTAVATYGLLAAGCCVTAFRAAVDARGVRDGIGQHPQ